MVSNRNRYVSESTTDDETADMEYLPNNQIKPPRKPTRTPKCFSKNALMARENRLKKKMYINSLEQQLSVLRNENKKLSDNVNSQASTIEELRNEVKYLKSILANSEGIGKLIKAINLCTDMSVSSSIDDKSCRTTRDVPIAKKPVPEMTERKTFNTKFDITRHPWEETNLNEPYENYPTPESTDSYYGSSEFNELNNDGLLLDIDIPIEMESEELLDMIDERTLDSPIVPLAAPIKTELEVKIKEEEDVGVCLHVSKNKVSLEFCPSCSNKALQGWARK
ncbi:CREB/ATF bZIP transcription factor-like isoform X2 [Euwallacea fornicatus]|uniref:CREB/ATF bZIP transcription factor-like isoform X2 n=1 Tax=Euwallacea fornicatus TaxID=995702 RepID=UPI00338E1A14